MSHQGRACSRNLRRDWRHGAPYRRDVWSQTVNDASPISAASHLIARSRAKPMQNRSERRRRRQFRLRDWRDINAAMSLRKKTAPREGDNWPKMAGLAQRNRGVDHRQSGAQNQNRRIRRGVPRTRVLPGAHERRLERFRGLVSAAQNRHIEDSGLTPGKAKGDGAVALAKARDGLAKPTQAPRLGLSETLFDQAAEVAAIDQARNKAKAVLAPMAV